MTQAKILIVGSTGYLGRHLSKHLKQQGYEVFITGSKKSAQPHHYQIIFSDKDSFSCLEEKKFNLVILLAARLNALGVTNLDHPDLKTNTIDYADFLEFLGKHQVAEKIIYASSMTVYSEKNRIPVKETDRISPVNTYGLSKYLAEGITAFFCEQNKIPGAILRIPGIYGGDRKSGFIYNTIGKLMSDNKVALQTQGLIYWETIHINDLCTMITSFVKNYSWRAMIDVFNVSYGEETDMYATARYIQKKLLKGEIVIEEKQKGYVPFYLSNEKLKTVIPVSKNYYEGLNEYINSFVA